MLSASIPKLLERRTVLSGSMQAVEEFCVDLRRRSDGLLDRASGFAIELLTREALTNAVVHGCQEDTKRQIRCAWRLSGRGFLLCVDDGGEGFDWRAAWNRQAGSGEASGRGVEILRKYASRVRYNDKGNVLIIFRRHEEGRHP